MTDSKPRKARKPKGECRMAVKHLGPITDADVIFGDLTVIVGPQATGKSIFLQTLKLVIDRDHIHDTFSHHSMSFNGNASAFLDGYFGRGMSAAWGANSQLQWNGKSMPLPDLTRQTKGKLRYERLFYIPAQRVMSLPGGVSQNFGQFNYGDPYTLRVFSDAVHDLIQNEFGAKGELFPAPNRLNETLRKPIADHLFGGNRLVVDDADFTKRLGLAVPGQKKPLGFLSWSAGQREFAPMLLGLYWLCTVATTRRKSGRTAKETIDWVVIEEPEMGLHPRAISAVLLLVLELLRRGYKVVLSSHSPVVLEMVWALQEFKKLSGDEADLRKMFELPASPAAKELGRVALKKNYRVYFFERSGRIRDISGLNPGAEDAAESEWGGLVGFSSRANEAIGAAVNRAETRPRRRRKTKEVAAAEGAA
jgi:AAA domain, putative AbiEii toxin, Type IV TA system